MARKGREQEEVLEAYLALGGTFFYAGQLASAQAALARGLRLRRAPHPNSRAFGMPDPTIVIREHLGYLAWLFGEEEEMLAHLAEMRRHASSLGDPFSLAYAHAGAATLHQFARDADAVRAEADALLALCTEHGFSLFVALARYSRGWALAVGSGQERGVDEIRAGIEQWQATGAKLLVPYQLGLLGDALAAVGRQETALGTVEEALEGVRRTGERGGKPSSCGSPASFVAGLRSAPAEPGGCAAGALPSPASGGPWRSLAARALTRSSIGRARAWPRSSEGRARCARQH
jgi:hypothetical protein